MQPIASRDTPAYRAARKFLRGVNLGDYLEAGPDWAIRVSAEDIRQIKAQGFDHIRVPVGWHRYSSPAPEFQLSREIFGKVDFVVTNALAHGLAVLINIHHFREFDADPAGSADQLVAIWRQVAEHYKDSPETLAFEVLNEPHDKATTAVMNDIYPRVISEIRKSNPSRTLFVEPGNWGNIPELQNLVLPPDDNVIVSVHCYDPFHFTHQGTSWGGPDVKVTGFRFPGPPETPLTIATNVQAAPWVHDRVKQYNTQPAGNNPVSATAFREKLRQARAWSDHYGRPVHIGEFGCYYKVDAESRTRYYEQFRKTAEELGIGWAIWDWSANFRYWDREKQQPLPGMREALFGQPSNP